MSASSTDKHSQMISAGWKVRLDGKWKPPDPSDRRVYTAAAAWLEHSERDEAPDDDGPEAA
jgi:hypothetical protein